MKVICKGNKTCENRKFCEHSNPHECNEDCDDLDFINLPECECHHRFLRKEKLNKITQHG